LILLPAPPTPLPQLTPAEAARQPLFVIGGNPVAPQQYTTQVAAPQPLYAIGDGQAPPPQQTTQTAAPKSLYVFVGSQALPQQQTPPEAAPQQLYVIGKSQAPPPSSYMLVPARAQPPHQGLLHLPPSVPAVNYNVLKSMASSLGWTDEDRVPLFRAFLDVSGDPMMATRRSKDEL